MLFFSRERSIFLMAFLDSLPADTKDPAYIAAVMNAVQQENFEVTWGTVHSEANGHKAEFRIFADALKIDGVRINVSSAMEQQIADALGCMLLTSKLADLIWYQRDVTLNPVLLVQTAADLQFMSTVKYMVKHSKMIDDQLAALTAKGVNTSGIRCDVGKHWLNSNVELQHPNTSINYGFFTATNQSGTIPCATKSATDPSAPCFVFQGPPERGSWAHGGTNHIDYSQVCVLVSRQCFVDNQVMDLVDVLKNPDLAPLASSEGVLKVLRQPGVAQVAQLVKQPPCVGPNCPKLISWAPGGDEFSRPSGGPLALASIALLLTVGGFFGGLWLMGRTTKGRTSLRENPVLTETQLKLLRFYADGSQHQTTGPTTYWLLENGYLREGRSSAWGTKYIITDKGIEALAEASAQENPLLSAEPFSPYTFDYRGVQTVLTKRRRRWCFKTTHGERCAPNFRAAIIDAKQLIDAHQDQ